MEFALRTSKLSCQKGFINTYIYSGLWAFISVVDLPQDFACVGISQQDDRPYTLPDNTCRTSSGALSCVLCGDLACHCAVRLCIYPAALICRVQPMKTSSGLHEPACLQAAASASVSAPRGTIPILMTLMTPTWWLCTLLAKVQLPRSMSSTVPATCPALARKLQASGGEAASSFRALPYRLLGEPPKAACKTCTCTATISSSSSSSGGGGVRALHAPVLAAAHGRILQGPVHFVILVLCCELGAGR